MITCIPAFPKNPLWQKHNYIRSQIYIYYLLSILDGLVICHLPYGPTAYFTLSNTVMRHDIPNIGTMSEVYPHLIFDKLSSKLGERVKHCSFFAALLHDFCLAKPACRVCRKAKGVIDQPRFLITNKIVGCHFNNNNMHIRTNLVSKFLIISRLSSFAYYFR